MLEGRNISFRYKKKSRSLLKDISINVERGKITFLEGPNGSGKTTLGLILAGVIPKLIKGEVQGKVLIDKEEIIENDYNFRKVGFLFQNPDNFFTTITPKEEINLSISKSTRPYDHNKIISFLKIDKLLDIPLSKLSFGQKQLVALAALLVLNPDYLILDEPFSHIDFETQKIIIKYLNKLPILFNKGLLIISYEIIKELKIKRRYRIEDGKVITKNISDQFVLVQKKINRIKKTDKNIVLEVSNLSFKYRGSSETVLDSIDFRINEGELVGIIGPNGSGKSSFLFAISSLLKRRKGKIYIFDDIRNKVSLKKYDVRKIALAFQNIDYQLFGTSVKEEIEYTANFLNYDQNKMNEFSECFRSVWTTIDLNSDPYSLSYGQKKVLSIYCALTASPKVILLDEPFSGLDSKNREIIIDKLFELTRHNKSVIITSHEEQFIKMICDNYYYIKDGKIE